MFRDTFVLGATTTILDLGSEGGEAIHSVILGTNVRPDNVYIADLSEEAILSGATRFGFRPVLIRDGEPLQFPDGFFDIVYCSSVIEHVTVPKSQAWSIRSGHEFRAQAERAQQRFASEIRRIGRGYFVQTPSRSFVIESHSWLPFVGWLPRPMFLATLQLSNRVWVKKTNPDFNLLDNKQLAELFPDAEIRAERFLGLTKSIIAIKHGGVSRLARP